jgi:DNA-binding response OmpR family regulator
MEQTGPAAESARRRAGARILVVEAEVALAAELRSVLAIQAGSWSNRFERRTRYPTEDPVVRVRELEIDLNGRTGARAGRVERLTPTEYALLRLFTEHLDKLLTEGMLLEAVWGPARLAGRWC